MADNGTSEAERRTAVGRVYYAMFGQSLVSLAKSGLVQPRMDGTDHQHIIQALTKSKRPAAGQALQNLRKLRNTSDYEYEVEVTADDVAKARAFAEAVKRQCSLDWDKP